MSNKKQTAVEWLMSEVWVRLNMDYEWREKIYEQAKAMEKEQIKSAYVFGLQDEYVIGSENYYNETYRGDTIQNNKDKMYSEEEVHNLLDILLEGDMCSVAGDELIEQFKHKITNNLPI